MVKLALFYSLRLWGRNNGDPLPENIPSGTIDAVALDPLPAAVPQGEQMFVGGRTQCRPAACADGAGGRKLVVRD